MKAISIIEFVVQSIVATIGAFVLGGTCGVLPSIVVALLVKNPGPGSLRSLTPEVSFLFPYKSQLAKRPHIAH